MQGRPPHTVTSAVIRSISLNISSFRQSARCPLSLTVADSPRVGSPATATVTGLGSQSRLWPPPTPKRRTTFGLQAIEAKLLPGPASAEARTRFDVVPTGVLHEADVAFSRERARRWTTARSGRGGRQGAKGADQPGAGAGRTAGVVRCRPTSKAVPPSRRWRASTGRLRFRRTRRPMLQTIWGGLSVDGVGSPLADVMRTAQSSGSNSR